MTLTYPKPFKSIDDLVELLTETRCLRCSDKQLLHDFLLNTNYYRFTGYARQWQKNPLQHDDQFEADASFEHIRKIMELDHQLRHVLLEQLSYIETSIRTRYAHELGNAYGEAAFYLNEDMYIQRCVKNEPIDIPGEIIKEFDRSKSTMLKHYKQQICEGQDHQETYADLPIWVAVEVLSFGKIAKMIGQFKNQEPAKEVAASIQVQWSPFPSIVHSFTVLRNMCAHHGQLWQRSLSIQCPVPKKIKHKVRKQFSPQSIYAAIVMLNHYREKIDQNTEAGKQIIDLIESDADFSAGIRNPVPK